MSTFYRTIFCFLDDEKSVEAEQREEENMKALLHKTPNHPLPEGLEKVRLKNVFFFI